MDSFAEQIVQLRTTSKDWAIIALISVATIVVGTGLVLLSFALGIAMLAIFALVLYFSWWLIRGQSKECEYCIVNGDLDIDLIIARRKRRRLVSVHGRNIETALPYKPEQFATKHFDRTVMAASSPDAEGVWAFTYRSKKNGHTLVLFQPDQRILELFLNILPRPLQIEARRRAGSV